jgi:antitoxin component HigA of HigAB toxin-antitoxin module
LTVAPDDVSVWAKSGGLDLNMDVLILKNLFSSALRVFSLPVEKFEEEHYPFGHATPLEALRFFMEGRDLRQRDMIPIFGSSSVASDVFNGKRSISKAHARKLAEFFHVSVSLFI